MKAIKDNFSGYSANYATYRPTPPPALYDFLYKQVAAFDTAWDCGTGNGQIALKLAEKFTTVYATDISTQQIEIAEKRNNIIYKTERAEQSSIPDNTIDLVTVAQAVHWFDFDAFNKEVERVSKPNAIISLITYYLLRVNTEVDKLIDELYWDITRPYWDKERQYVDDKYLTIPFPFKEIQTPSIDIELNWNLEHLLGYIRTWSGLQHYIQQKNEDPVSLLRPRFEQIWNAGEIKQVKFPLFIRTGRILK